jgi:UDP-N-acetylglucosamine/UDP-N-acetylgalactosamine 4-epimerase
MNYQTVQRDLGTSPRTWLVTGAAGFIGSNIVESLLRLNQRVVGLDNLSTGKTANLDEVKSLVDAKQWAAFVFHEGDIRELGMCKRVCEGVDYVLHQAALGSVPRSIADPIGSNESNVSGFINMLVAGRDQKVKRFVYAASSSTYGDHPALPKTEDVIGRPLSPYAVTKYVNELYADVFGACYGMQSVGLRYFNVFGPRQDPEGAYAAVIPRWISAMIRKQPCQINGDGETTRDFCYIANAVQANILAACTTKPEAICQVYNVALNERTSLNQLFEMLRERLVPEYPHLKNARPVYQEFRSGDVRHSQADIVKARRLLGYSPTHTVEQGLDDALAWYKVNLQ